jgi:hypothetical protein
MFKDVKGKSQFASVKVYGGLRLWPEVRAGLVLMMAPKIPQTKPIFLAPLSRTYQRPRSPISRVSNEPNLLRARSSA